MWISTEFFFFFSHNLPPSTGFPGLLVLSPDALWRFVQVSCQDLQGDAHGGGHLGYHLSLKTPLQSTWCLQMPQSFQVPKAQAPCLLLAPCNRKSFQLLSCQFSTQTHSPAPRLFRLHWLLLTMLSAPPFVLSFWTRLFSCH